MATKFSEIYCLNKLIKNDPRLKNLDVVQLDMLCFGYLKFAISYFMYDCRKNLADREDPIREFYEFDADGIDNEFLLSPAPPANSNFYVTVTSGDDVVSVSDFAYDDSSGILKLSVAPGVGAVVNVVAYVDGSFNESLDDREMVILAEGMNIPYIEQAKNDQNAMKYIVAGKSLRFFSQANHTEASIKNYDSQAYDIVDSLISEYSYKGSEDKYRGLAKRGRG